MKLPFLNPRVSRIGWLPARKRPAVARPAPELSQAASRLPPCCRSVLPECPAGVRASGEACLRQPRTAAISRIPLAGLERTMIIAHSNTGIQTRAVSREIGPFSRVDFRAGMLLCTRWRQAASADSWEPFKSSFGGSGLGWIVRHVSFAWSAAAARREPIAAWMLMRASVHTGGSRAPSRALNP